MATFSLQYIEVDDEQLACVVRDHDGAYISLSEVNKVLDLAISDERGYDAVMFLVQKLAWTGRRVKA